MLNRIKRKLPQRVTLYLYTRKRRLGRIWSILQTPYWRLAYQDRLNYNRHTFEPPEINVVAQDGDMELLEIGGLRIFWPQEYERRVLIGSYCEIFAPSLVNPHAYEDGDIQLKHGDWVVDAGACEGFFTFLALQRGANVLMVEPVPRLAAALACTFAQEIRSGKVKLIQAALGEKPGKGRLSVDPSSIVISKIAASGQEDVPIIALDQLLSHNVIPRVDFLKMDIEGFETAAMRGAINILKEQMPCLSIAVYHEFENARLLRDFILRYQPKYHIRFRGVFLRPGHEGGPRPFMLLGIS